MTRSLLAALARRATFVLPASVAVGLLVPELAAFLRPALTPLILLLLMQSMVRTDWPALRRLAAQPARLLAALAYLMVGLPLAAAALAFPLGLPEGLAAAVVVMSLCPPMTSAPALAPLLGLNQPLTLIVAIAGLLVAPFTLPPMALGLLGLDLAVGVGPLMLRLAALIGGALAGALLIRRWLGPRLETAAPVIDGLGVLLLVLFAIAIFDGVAAQIAADPARVALFAMAAFAAHLVYQLLTVPAWLWMGLQPALTLGFLAGTRNMGLLLAVLPLHAEPAVALFVATVQFPIYIMPTLLKPIYRAVFARGRAGASPSGG